MPNRLLRDWTDSLRFDGITAEAERLFTRLIMKADDYGRFHAEPRLIKASCFPLFDNLRTPDLVRWLDELSTRQLILRYEAEGRSLLAIVNYGQRLKQSRAKFPPPPDQPDDYLPVSEHFREVPGSSGNVPLEGKGRESEGEARSENSSGSGGARSAGSRPREFIPPAELVAQVNSLRPAWAAMAELGHLERTHMEANLKALESIGPETWDLFRRYMAARLPASSGGWQPKQRIKFLESPGDLIAHAAEWQDRQPKPRSPATSPVSDPSPESPEDPAANLRLWQEINEKKDVA